MSSRMYRKLFSFLQDEQIVEFINSNFLCYKFNINESESLTFNKKEYEKNESKNGIISEYLIKYCVSATINKFLYLIKFNKSIIFTIQDFYFSPIYLELLKFVQ